MRSELKYIQSHNELRSFDRLDQWQARRDELKERILVSAGLWPLPLKGELNAKIFDKITYDDFTVEKVVFESYPGFYVTGNLYRPLGKAGPVPGILNPHGHWHRGRLEMIPDGTAEQTVELPTRCANFAMMGMVAFSYDMVGYLDSRQIGHAYEGEEKQIWGSSLLGLQLWNSIRSLDFMLSLPEIDPQNIGCTGASGGGTQTFLLGAVDDRVKASVPVNMIAADFQGGCRCENAPNLRIDANNVEFAALFAPRPMLVTGCTGDWTKQVPNREYPALRAIYELYGAADNVDYFYDDAGHNYNGNTRAAAYRWLGRHLQGRDEAWQERQVRFGDLERFRIYAESFPAEGISSKEELFVLQKSGKMEMLQQLWDSNRPEDDRLLATAMKHVFCVPEPSGAYQVQLLEDDRTDPAVDDGLIANLDIRRMVVEGEGVGLTLLLANRRGVRRNGKTWFVVHPGGYQGLLRDAQWREELEQRLDEGCAIASANIHLTGGFGVARDCLCVDSLTTYNLTDTTLRVHDIVTVFRYLQADRGDELNVMGIGDAGVWTLAALPYLYGVHTAVIDVNGFRMDDEDDARFATRFFVPHFRAAGGFAASVMQSAANRLALRNAIEDDFVQLLGKLCYRRGKALIVN